MTIWNTGASRILGWEPAEMLGQSLCRVFAEQDQEAQLIVKPFSFSDLAAKVRDVLDGASD